MVRPSYTAERRQAVVGAAIELISDFGIEMLSNRKIADRLGLSTSVVTHYFADKTELVLVTYHATADAAADRVTAAVARAEDPLTVCVAELLPLDPVRLREWKVWSVFQGLAVGNESLTEAWRHRAASAVDRIATIIREQQKSGGVLADVAPEFEGRRLLALVHGIGFQAVVDPVGWSPGLQMKLIESELIRLRAPMPVTARRRRPASR